MPTHSSSKCQKPPQTVTIITVGGGQLYIDSCFL